MTFMVSGHITFLAVKSCIEGKYVTLMVTIPLWLLKGRIDGKLMTLMVILLL